VRPLYRGSLIFVYPAAEQSCDPGQCGILKSTLVNHVGCLAALERRTLTVLKVIYGIYLGPLCFETNK
jgi:hypothetical protein